MRVRFSFSSRKTGQLDRHSQHRIEYPKLVLDLITDADIILEVLDSRFIEKMRNEEFEKFVTKSGKKIIYVFNKVDLADITQILKTVEISSLKPHVFVSCRVRRGIGELRKKIKIESKKLQLDRDTKVGVIGYPNTGKSSVINMLIGKSSAATASQAGWTKGIQKLRLSESILLLDTPGVIPEKHYGFEKDQIFRQAEIGVRDYHRVKEPEMIIHQLMKKYPGAFEKFYNLDVKGDSELLIEELGKKHHLFIKGGEVDIDKTARKILKDWQEGRIK